MFRVIDTETASIEGGICEIAYVDSDGECITGEFGTLTDPECEISVDAMAIHHITNDMVKDAPSGKRIASVAASTQLVKVAHNAEFDASVIGDDVSGWICTLKLCRHFYPDAPKHSNQYMRYYLGLEVKVPDGLYPHRALYDCYVTEAILRRIISEFNPSVEDMIRISRDPSIIKVMRFGKYSGRLVEDIAFSDPSYIRWCLDKMDLDDDTRFTFNKVLGL